MCIGEESYRRFLLGDDEGLVEIIRDYKDGLMLYLCGICGDLQTAEELMEETFTKIAIKRPHFAGKSTFKTWLYAIGRNTAMDYMRHRARFTHKPLEENDISTERDALEQMQIAEEQKMQLHRALAKLKPEYRQALYLVYFEDFTKAETAAVMKKNKRQIENLLYRAKAALKNILEEEGFVYEEL